MRLDTLIFRIVNGSFRFFYEILYDMVCIVKNLAVHATCTISELPCIIRYYVGVLRVALISIKMIYDAVGPDFKKIKHYNVKFDNQLQIRRDDDVLIQTSIGLPKLQTSGLLDLFKDADAGKVMASGCDKKCKRCRECRCEKSHNKNHQKSHDHKKC